MRRALKSVSGIFKCWGNFLILLFRGTDCLFVAFHVHGQDSRWPFSDTGRPVVWQIGIPGRLLPQHEVFYQNFKPPRWNKISLSNGKCDQVFATKKYFFALTKILHFISKLVGIQRAKQENENPFQGNPFTSFCSSIHGSDKWDFLEAINWTLLPVCSLQMRWTLWDMEVANRRIPTIAAFEVILVMEAVRWAPAISISAAPYEGTPCQAPPCRATPGTCPITSWRAGAGASCPPGGRRRGCVRTRIFNLSTNGPQPSQLKLLLLLLLLRRLLGVNGDEKHTQTNKKTAVLHGKNVGKSTQKILSSSTVDSTYKTSLEWTATRITHVKDRSTPGGSTYRLAWLPHRLRQLQKHERRRDRVGFSRIIFSNPLLNFYFVK